MGRRSPVTRPEHGYRYFPESSFVSHPTVLGLKCRRTRRCQKVFPPSYPCCASLSGCSDHRRELVGPSSLWILPGSFLTFFLASAGIKKGSGGTSCSRGGIAV